MLKSKYAKRRDFSSLTELTEHDELHTEEELEKLRLSPEDEEDLRQTAVYPPPFSGPGAPNVITDWEDKND